MVVSGLWKFDRSPGSLSDLLYGHRTRAVLACHQPATYKDVT
jgi:hypothetical protein